MKDWLVEFQPEFYEEFKRFSDIIQDSILSKSLLLQCFGPQLGRPHVDTLHGSRYPNMKELRLDADKGVWRVAFAFDPKRKAVLLVAGEKVGASQKTFYTNLIRKADNRFNKHLISFDEK